MQRQKSEVRVHCYIAFEHKRLFVFINENDYRDMAVNLNTKKLRSMQSMGEAFYIHCRMAHSQRENYLLLNCGALRAALRPYFLRSFILGSLVRNPAALRTGL